MHCRLALAEWPFGEEGMGALIRDYDWGATPLGSLERWPNALRTAVDIMMAMPRPATIMWGPQHIQLYNDAYITIARDRHPLLLGRPVAEGWPDVYSRVIAPLLENARAGRATQLNEFVVTLHGPAGLEERVFDSDWVPIRDESGAVAGTLQTLVEATDRVKAQAAVRVSEARHSLLIESWAQAVWETDSHGLVIADSPSWRAYTGQTLQEWLGYGWLNAIHPDDRAYAEQQWREAAAAKRLVNAEFRLRAPNGEWRWTNVRASPMLDANGNINKWVGMNVDIDARKRAEAALSDSEERQSFFLMLSDTLASVADSVQIQAEAARVLGQRLDADRVAYYEIDGDDYVVQKDWAKSGLSLAGRHPISSFGQSLAEKHRRGETTIVVPDVAEAHSEEQLRNFAAIGVGAYIGITLVKEGRFVAGLTIHSAIPRAWKQNEVEMARETAERTWSATERARAEAVLRDHEERQTFQLQLSDALASLSDPDNIMVAATRLVAGELGISWCYFYEFDDRGTHATVRGDYHRDGVASMVGIHDLSGERGFLDLMYSDAMLDMPDLLSSELFSAQARADYGALGIRSALGAPLLQSGRLAAVLLVADTNVRRWTRGDSELLRGVAERTLAAIQRVRAEAALAKSVERQRTLVAELQHRTFNLIGVVRSMADATIRSSASLDDFKVMFRNRIAALARVQRLLSAESDDRITFSELIRSELDAAGAFSDGNARVTLNGPEGVALRSSTVQTFAMALHELTTNSVKYGALKQPSAHLNVFWRVEIANDCQPWLHVDWIETGVVMPEPRATTSGTGQGRRLLEGALPYQLNAKTTFVMGDDGIRCSIALPLSTRALTSFHHAAQ